MEAHQTEFTTAFVLLLIALMQAVTLWVQQRNATKRATFEERSDEDRTEIKENVRRIANGRGVHHDNDPPRDHNQRSGDTDEPKPDQ